MKLYTIDGKYKLTEYLSNTNNSTCNSNTNCLSNFCESINGINKCIPTKDLTVEQLASLLNSYPFLLPNDQFINITTEQIRGLLGNDPVLIQNKYLEYLLYHILDDKIIKLIATLLNTSLLSTIFKYDLDLYNNIHRFFLLFTSITEKQISSINNPTIIMELIDLCDLVAFNNKPNTLPMLRQLKYITPSQIGLLPKSYISYNIENIKKLFSPLTIATIDSMPTCTINEDCLSKYCGSVNSINKCMPANDCSNTICPLISNRNIKCINNLCLDDNGSAVFRNDGSYGKATKYLTVEQLASLLNSDPFLLPDNEFINIQIDQIRILFTNNPALIQNKYLYNFIRKINDGYNSFKKIKIIGTLLNTSHLSTIFKYPLDDYISNYVFIELFTSITENQISIINDPIILLELINLCIGVASTNNSSMLPMLTKLTYITPSQINLLPKLYVSNNISSIKKKFSPSTIKEIDIIFSNTPCNNNQDCPSNYCESVKSINKCMPANDCSNTSCPLISNRNIKCINNLCLDDNGSAVFRNDGSYGKATKDLTVEQLASLLNSKPFLLPVDEFNNITSEQIRGLFGNDPPLIQNKYLSDIIINIYKNDDNIKLIATLLNTSQLSTIFNFPLDLYNNSHRFFVLFTSITENQIKSIDDPNIIKELFNLCNEIVLLNNPYRLPMLKQLLYIVPSQIGLLQKLEISNLANSNIKNYFSPSTIKEIDSTPGIINYPCDTDIICITKHCGLDSDNIKKCMPANFCSSYNICPTDSKCENNICINKNNGSVIFRNKGSYGILTKDLLITQLADLLNSSPISLDSSEINNITDVQLQNVIKADPPLINNIYLPEIVKQFDAKNKKIIPLLNKIQIASLLNTPTILLDESKFYNLTKQQIEGLLLSTPPLIQNIYLEKTLKILTYKNVNINVISYLSSMQLAFLFNSSTILLDRSEFKYISSRQFDYLFNNDEPLIQNQYIEQMIKQLLLENISIVHLLKYQNLAFLFNTSPIGLDISEFKKISINELKYLFSNTNPPLIQNQYLSQMIKKFRIEKIDIIPLFNNPYLSSLINTTPILLDSSDYNYITDFQKINLFNSKPSVILDKYFIQFIEYLILNAPEINFVRYGYYFNSSQINLLLISDLDFNSKQISELIISFPNEEINNLFKTKPLTIQDQYLIKSIKSLSLSYNLIVNYTYITIGSLLNNFEINLIFSSDFDFNNNQYIINLIKSISHSQIINLFSDKESIIQDQKLLKIIEILNRIDKYKLSNIGNLLNNSQLITLFNSDLDLIDNDTLHYASRLSYNTTNNQISNLFSTRPLLIKNNYLVRTINSITVFNRDRLRLIVSLLNSSELNIILNTDYDNFLSWTVTFITDEQINNLFNTKPPIINDQSLIRLIDNLDYYYESSKINLIGSLLNSRQIDVIYSSNINFNSKYIAKINYNISNTQLYDLINTIPTQIQNNSLIKFIQVLATNNDKKKLIYIGSLLNTSQINTIFTSNLEFTNIRILDMIKAITPLQFTNIKEPDIIINIIKKITNYISSPLIIQLLNNITLTHISLLPDSFFLYYSREKILYFPILLQEKMWNKSYFSPPFNHPNSKTLASEDNCARWVKNNECVDNPKYMYMNCFSKCPVIPDNLKESLPFDFPDAKKYATETSCARWAKNNECNNNPEYMYAYCYNNCPISSDTIQEGINKPNESSCSAWANNNECKNKINFMYGFCSNYCPSPSVDYIGAKLVATHDNCKKWADNNECTTNPNYMYLNCPDMCQLPPDIDFSEAKTLITNENCTIWAKDNKCNTKSKFMYANCLSKCTIPSEITPEDKKNVPNEISCTAWANNGECNNNPTFMYKNCQSKCPLPPFNTFPEDNILATDDNCKKWANNNECVPKSKFMYKYCSKNCPSSESEKNNFKNKLDAILYSKISEANIKIQDIKKILESNNADEISKLNKKSMDANKNLIEELAKKNEIEKIINDKLNIDVNNAIKIRDENLQSIIKINEIINNSKDAKNLERKKAIDDKAFEIKSRIDAYEEKYIKELNERNVANKLAIAKTDEEDLLNFRKIVSEQFTVNKDEDNEDIQILNKNNNCFSSLFIYVIVIFIIIIIFVTLFKK